MSTQGRQHRAVGGGEHASTHTPPPQIFCIAKRKKGNKGIKGFKAETIKRLSPRSKSYCFSHSRSSEIQTFFLSANRGGMVAYMALLLICKR